MTETLNPLNGTPLSEDGAELVKKLRKVRRNARRAARSGNPAKSADARKALGTVRDTLSALYWREASQ